MGNRPTPTKLKLLMGNPGGRPINRNEPEPERKVPKMPGWLRGFPAAKKEWRREVAILDAMGVMTVAETGALAMRCYLAGEIQGLALEIGKEGRTVTSDTGEKSNPKCIQLKNLITEYRQIGSLLGFDPTSRTRMSVDPSHKKKSKFEGLVNVRKKQTG